MSYISDELLDYQGSSMEGRGAKYLVAILPTRLRIEISLIFFRFGQIILRLRRASSATLMSDEAGAPAR